MNQKKSFIIGHPAYTGANRFQATSSFIGAYSILKARGIPTMLIAGNLRYAMEGHFVTISNRDFEVIELRYDVA